MEERHLVVPALEKFRLHKVPPKSDLKGWLVWREACIVFRRAVREAIKTDDAFQQDILKLCSEDPIFWLILFGVIHEPRSVVDLRVVNGEIKPFRKRKGWYPWIPYPFQVQTIRTIREILDGNVEGDDDDDDGWWEEDESGRGDIVLEKSRDMGATWSMCAVAAHDWLFGEEVFIGMLSRKEDMVDSKNPGSMFYKLEALIGIFPNIPPVCKAPKTFYDGVDLALPEYLIPSGLDRKLHDQKLNLIHPSRNNQIMGEATTSLAGIGNRTNYTIIDEGAKIKELEDIWEGMNAVTDHRIVLGSADRRYGDGMYNLVRQARLSLANPDEPGPTLISLNYRENPVFTERWARRQRKRLANRPYSFEREYEIDWNAGMGDWVYPYTLDMGYSPNKNYDPTLGEILIVIDPALRDPTAVGFLQYNPRINEWNLFESVVLKTPTARILTPLLLGFPPGHPVYNEYPEERFQEILQLMWRIRKDGLEVTFVGDPYGTNVGGADQVTYYMALYMHSEELGEQYTHWNGELIPPAEVMVMVNFAESARTHRPRKEALTNLLPILRINDAPGPRQFLYHLQNHRYKSQEEGRLVQNEPTNPAHEEHSHAVTALEFGAVYIQIDKGFYVANVEDKSHAGPNMSDYEEYSSRPSRELAPVAM